MGGHVSRSGPTTWPLRLAVRLRRDVPLALLDLFVVFAAYLVSLVLRFDGSVPGRWWQTFRVIIPVAVFLHLLANYLLGLYGQMWRYASVQEARRLALASFLGAGMVLAANFFSKPQSLPMSVVGFGALLSLGGFGAIRFQSRLFAFRRNAAGPSRRRVLLVGAGSAGSLVLKDILRNPSMGLDPVGFVDDDPSKHGLALHGVLVLGDQRAIPSLVKQLHVDEVLLSISSATNEVVRDFAAQCEAVDVSMRVLPSVKEAVHGRMTARDLRDLRIEDLLGRQQIETDIQAVASLIRGQCVLVTGAGGSIGSEIARQVASFGPSSLVLLDHDETHLHEVLLDLTDDVRVSAVLADVRDQRRVHETFSHTRPEVIFHAAAHKHVSFMEAFPEEALYTNVLGTANVVDAAVAHSVQRFVFISTDKAVNPSSVMGASKWFAEQIVLGVRGERATFSAVRFGNVVGSRGSVIPTFLRQVAKGGPVTVTDPEMSRFFMSISEAVQLVLQAAALSEGGEVFTLEMGEPVSILELARRIIRLSGRVPGKDIDITFVGSRPGEKLVEEIAGHDEQVFPSQHPSILFTRPRVPDRRTLMQGFRELEILAREGSRVDLASRIKELAGLGREPATAGVGG